MMNEKELKMARALVESEQGAAAPMVRRLSAASLVMLDMLGNPLAGLPAEDEEVGLYAVAEFAWLHAAEEDEVRARVVAHELHPGGVKLAVLEWAEGYSEADLLGMMQRIRGEVGLAGDVLTLVENGDAGKNGYGPCLR